MLTRELLRYHVRRGVVRPRFVALQDSTLLAHAEALVHAVDGATGLPRGALDERLADCLQAGVEPLIHRGLVKLLTDRCDFAEAPAEVSTHRLQCFTASTAALRNLSPDATWQDLHRAMPGVDPARLYDDLPEHRPLTGWRPLEPTALLQRYNMALAQGLLMGCEQFTVRTPSHDVLALRRLLRWLKFCRLVAEIRRMQGDGWEITITGPAAVLALSKAYGMQLANFLPAVPLLQAFSVEADVVLRKPNRWTLSLSHTDPLVSPHGQALGHVPAEMQTLLQAFADAPEPWALSTEIEPCPVGPTGMMVPDLVFRRSDGQERRVELFHRWHHHALAQRLTQLAARPDPQMLLGIDRSLLKQERVATALAQAGGACTFEFSGFPTPRRMRAALDHADTGTNPVRCATGTPQ